MSTKIYNGFRIKLNSLQSIHKATMRLRKELEPMEANKVKEYITHVATTIYDRYTLGLPLPSDYGQFNVPLGYATFKYWDACAKIEQTQRRNPLIDTSFEIAILPVSKNLILGIAYVEDKNFLELLMKQDWVEEYGYWDNTDKPENLTDQEWEQRGRNWNKALSPGKDIPAQSGLSADLTRGTYYSDVSSISDKDITKFQHSRKHRIDYWADELCLKEWSGQKKIELNKIIAEFRNYRTAVQKDPVWRKKLMAYKEKVGSKLVPRIKKGQLLQKLEENS